MGSLTLSRPSNGQHSTTSTAPIGAAPAIAFVRMAGVLVIVLALLAFARTQASADTFKQVNVVIDQLDDATVPDTTQRQKDMNDILKQCDKYKIKLRVTLNKVNKKDNPKGDDGNPISPDGKTDLGAREKLRKHALDNEVKDGGYKIYVAKEVNTADGAANGVTVPGTQVSIITEQNGVNGDARTWTHEMGHGMGGLDDLTADGDLSNLMYGARKSGDKTAGSDLTEDECKALDAGADKLKPSTDKTKEQETESSAKSTERTITGPPSGPPVLGTPADLKWVRLVFDHNLINPLDNSLYVDIHINTPITHPPATQYSVWLDLDNNPSTGDPNGFDAVLQERITSPAQGQGVLLLWGGEGTFPLDPPSVQVTGEAASGETFSSMTLLETVLSSRVSLVLLGPIADQVRVAVTAQDGTLGDMVGPEIMPTIPLPEPTLTINPDTASAGEPVAFAGTGWAPSSGYVILFDDTIVASGTTTNTGELTGSFPAPSLDPDDYLVDSIDATGLVQVRVLRMGNGTDTIGQALGLPDGSAVGLSGKSVTGFFPGQVGWIEEHNRSAAVQVLTDTNLSEGLDVTIFGKMATLGSVRLILTDSVGVNPSTTHIVPLAMNNRALGGGTRNAYTPGVTGGQGLNNIGMLVLSWGMVTSAGTGYFYVDDGSGLLDGTGNRGVRVFSTGLTNAAPGQFVVVTGIVNAAQYTPSGDTIRLLIPRDQSDIAVVGQGSTSLKVL